MEVKQILEKVRQQKKESAEPFFALQIEAHLVKSAIWTVKEGRVKVLSLGEAQSWPERQDLLEAVDNSLSSATNQLPADETISEPNKVIFGLPSTWVKGEKIVKAKIDLLREISQKLELKPAGFVVTTEAIVHHLKNTEGVPPTAVMVGLRREKIAVTLTSLGKIMGTQVVKRSGELGADLAEGLLRFEDQDRFPARILLYAKELGLETELEEARQGLIGYPWQEQGVEFLHLPKTEILPEDFDIKAVALAGGQEVAKAEGIDILGKKIEEKEKKKEERTEPEETPFGFVKDKDVTQEKPAPPLPTKGQSLERKFRFPFGFKLPPPRFLNLGSILAKFTLGRRLPAVVVLVGSLIVVLFGVLLALYWYLPRAEVLLLAKTQKLEKEFEIGLDPSLERVDPEGLRLPTKEAKATLEDEMNRQTTGVKLVGDPAKGEVVIYNRTSSEKTFGEGTKIVGPGELEFSLDEEVMVASESAGADYARIPGKATVAVTAVEIGTEGNLAAEAEFVVDKFAKSEFVAKNESAFGGGTSREVQVVSEEDQEKLLAELKEKLADQAEEKLLSQISPGEKLLAESLTTEVLEKSFDEKAGEEKAETKLKLKIEAKALVYEEEELQGMIEAEILRSIPADFEYRREESQIAFELKEVGKDGVAVFKAQFEANLVPKFDLEQVGTNLAGKYPSIGQAYLENLPYVEAVEIKITPPLPARLLTFPRRASRIKIEVRIE